jgi:hypothetical protein
MYALHGVDRQDVLLPFQFEAEFASTVKMVGIQLSAFTVNSPLSGEVRHWQICPGRLFFIR